MAAKYTDHPGQRHRSTSGTPQEASDTSDSGKGFFSGRSVAFWTILGSVATVLSLLVAVVTLMVSTRAPTPAQQGEATGPIRPGTPTAGLAESIPVGASPSSLAMAPDGHHAYVTHLSGALPVIDTTANAVTATIDVGGGALGAAVTPDGRHVYVAHWGSTFVSVIDTATNTVSATINVGTVQWDVAVTPDRRWAYVTNRGSGIVSVINTATNTVATTVDVGGDRADSPVEVVVTPDGRRAYVTNRGSGTVSMIDTATYTVTATIPVQVGANGLAVAPDGRYVYVPTKAPIRCR